jgi:serine/threonine protein kinase
MCPVCGTAYGVETAFCATDGAKLLEVEEASSVFADQDPLVRQLIGGRYRVLKRLGEGGMGVVYLAEHEAIEKRVAVKVLKDQYAQREDVVARFQQEAKSASRVKHEGILEIFDFGRTEDGRFFLAMELLDGADLAHVLEKEGTCDPPRTVRLGIKMARALAAAHQKGVIHRDMKPENVFTRIGDDGYERIKIVDFGIAQLRADGEKASDPNAKVTGRKLTKTGMIFGTPEYMSPEQAAGKNIDQRVDVYALGIILFEMLTGKTPFQGETFMAILSAHLMHPVPALVDVAPPGFYCSPDLEAVVRRALAKDPEQRFRSMPELAEALMMTPEGMMEEARPSMVRSSQFPSGMLGPAAQTPGTDYRMRSQSPPAMSSAMYGQPPRQSLSAGPPVPYAPAGSLPPPPGSQMGAGTMSGYMGNAVSAHDVGAATLYDQHQPHSGRQTTSSAEAALTSTQTPKKSSGLAVVFVMIAMIGVLGTGGYFGYRAITAGNTTSVPTSSAPVSTKPTKPEKPRADDDDDDDVKPATSTSTAKPSATASETEAPAPKQVLVHVETQGAVIEKLVGKDWVQVCDKSPCDVPIDVGTVASLRATKGGLVGPEKKLQADKDQKVLLAVGTAPKPSATPKPSGEVLCEVMVGEIKVLRPCAPK